MNSELAIYDVNIHQETNNSYTMTISNRSYHFYDEDALLDALRKYLKKEKSEKKKIEPEDVLGPSNKVNNSSQITSSGMPDYFGSSGVTGLCSSWCSTSSQPKFTSGGLITGSR